MKSEMDLFQIEKDEDIRLPQEGYDFPRGRDFVQHALERTRSDLDSVPREAEDLGREPEQAREDYKKGNRALEESHNELREQVRLLTAEQTALFYSHEYRMGDLLLNRLHLRTPLEAAHWFWVAFRNRLVVAGLAFERRLLTGHGDRHRILTTVCSNFPIYSQTFVYQELTQLARQGCDLRLVYSRLEPHDYLSPQFEQLWKAKRRLSLNWKIHERDFAYYYARMPEKVESLVQKLCEASGFSRRDLLLCALLLHLC